MIIHLWTRITPNKTNHLFVSIRAHGWIRLFCLVLLISLSFARAQAAETSQIVIGPARFTLITPNLIRIEYANDGQFTDAPTLFAANRDARFVGASVRQTHDQLIIDTGAIQLIYHIDGKPFTAANLSAVIRRKNKDTHWAPGMADPLNLGGTLRTLDGKRGPVDLGVGLISRSGWAVVDDSGSPVLTSDWVKDRPNKEETDWYLFGYGLDYHAALKSLAAISGPVPLPRKNLLGIWYSRYWPYTAAEFKQIVQQYAQHGFPLDNIVMDMDWHITHFPGVQQEAWTGYTWNRDLIPDPPALLKWFHEQGLFVTLNDHPAQGVQPMEQAYPAFMRAMGDDPASKITLPFDAGSKKYLDAFYATTHEPLEKEGVDFWWLDWQQFPDTISVPDLQNLPWLNRYNFTRSSADDRRGVSFSRWGGWGDQKYPIHFSGDAGTDWPMLAFEVPFTSTSGNVGCFFWTHDIGGHMGGRNEESYARWCQFGALSASLRSHSTRKADMDRRPWTYPKWAEDSMRISFQLRSELFPYIYTSVAESCEQMEPLLRPMYFEHPDLEQAYHNAQEYYLGDNLLVAPIAMAGFGPSRMAWQRVWFPPGDAAWFNYFTGEKYDPGTRTVVASDINQFPLFVRGGMPLVMQAYTPRPATAVLNHVIVRCYPGEDGSSGSWNLYEDDGQTQAYLHGESAQTTFLYRRHGHRYTLSISPTARHYAGQPKTWDYTLEFACLAKPESVDIGHRAAAIHYNAGESMLTVEMSDYPIDKPLEVEVHSHIADANVIREQAAAERISGVVGREVKPAAIRQMLVDALRAGNPDKTTALLAAAGVEIFPENDAPYLFGGHDVYRLHAEPGILDSDLATISLESTQMPSQITPNRTIHISDGGSIDVSSLRNDLPREDSVEVPGKSPTLRVGLQIAGKLRVVSLPVQVTAPASLDLARQAKATASSAASDSPADGAIDGVVAGYPGNRHHEWASGQQNGASLTLTWKSPQNFSEIALYDRPDDPDQVLAGRIVFDDGSVIPFGELANDGATPTLIHFAPKTEKSMRVEITKVSDTTRYTGLAEVAVYK